MTDLADDEFLKLTEKITLDRGFSCANYKERCLRRRIAVRMRARGTSSFDEYSSLLDRDPAEYEKLVDALTINVTKFFRNRESWAALDRLVVRKLWDSNLDRIRVWSAGCATGEEAYSIAALFHMRASAAGEGDAASRVEVVATDIDRASLAAAAAAEYKLPDFAETPEEIRLACFRHDPPYSPIPQVRSMVRIGQFDLLSNVQPPESFHLIVCRNVLIYFDRESQESLFDRFHAALARGGYVFLGKVETVLGATRRRFTVIDSRDRIFSKGA